MKQILPYGSIPYPHLNIVDIPQNRLTLPATYAGDKATLSSNSISEQASNILPEHLTHLLPRFKRRSIKINQVKSFQITFTLHRSYCPPVFLNTCINPSASSVGFSSNLLYRLTRNPHIHKNMFTRHFPLLGDIAYSLQTTTTQIT